MAIEWNIDPELVRLFGVFPIRYYSLLFMAGLVLGYFVVKRIWLREGLSAEAIEQLVIYVFLGTVIGARLGHCLFYEPGYYLSHPLEIFLPFTIENGNFEFTGLLGLASHGGILGVVVGILLFSRKSNLSVLSILDKVSIGGALAGVFIRIANFFNSEILGIPTHSNYGVIFKQVDDVVRHPAQLYEALAYFVIFIIVYKVYQTKKDHLGFTFGLFFTLLFLARFLIEFVKINQVAFEDGMALNMGQLLSIPFMLLGLWMMYWKRGARK